MRSSIGVLACLLGACTSPTAPPSPAPSAAPVGSASARSDRCPEAASLRARAAERAAKGRLFRALVALDQADAACPAPDTGARELRLSLLIDLGRYDEARALLTALESSTPSLSTAAAVAKERLLARSRVVTPADRARGKDLFAKALVERRNKNALGAKQLFLEAWEVDHPNGVALAEAGLVDKALRDVVSAQALFDRALAECEAETKQPTRIALHQEPQCQYVNSSPYRLAWLDASRLVIACDDAMSVVDLDEQREVFRGEAAFELFADGRALWHTLDTAALPRLRFHESPRLGLEGSVHAYGFTDGRTAVASNQGVEVRAADGKLLWTVAASTTVTALAFSRDGARLALAEGMPSTIRIVELSSGKTVLSVAAGKTPPGRTDSGLFHIAFAGGDALLVTAPGSMRTRSGVFDASDPVDIRRVAGGALVKRIPAGVDFMVLDDKRLAVHHEGRTEIRALDSGMVLKSLSTGIDPALSPGGERVAYVINTSGDDGPFEPRVLRVRTGVETSIPTQPSGDSVEFPDTIAGPGGAPALLSGPRLAWTITEPLPVVRWFSSRGGDWPRALELPSGERLDDNWDEAGLGGFDPERDPPKQLRTLDPRGPVEVIDPSIRPSLHCRVGPHRLPFDVCEDRFHVSDLRARVARGDRSFLEP